MLSPSNCSTEAERVAFPHGPCCGISSRCRDGGLPWTRAAYRPLSRGAPRSAAEAVHRGLRRLLQSNPSRRHPNGCPNFRFESLSPSWSVLYALLLLLAQFWASCLHLNESLYIGHSGPLNGFCQHLQKYTSSAHISFPSEIRTV